MYSITALMNIFGIDSNRSTSLIKVWQVSSPGPILMIAFRKKGEEDGKE